MGRKICDATGCFVKVLPMGQNIVFDKLYAKISILEQQAAVIVELDFRNLKSTRNKTITLSICLDHTYMYIVLRVPYTCNFITIDSIM